MNNDLLNISLKQGKSFKKKKEKEGFSNNSTNNNNLSNNSKIAISLLLWKISLNISKL